MDKGIDTEEKSNKRDGLENYFGKIMDIGRKIKNHFGQAMLIS